MSSLASPTTPTNTESPCDALPPLRPQVRVLDAPIELFDARRGGKGGGGRSYEVPAGVRLAFSSAGFSLDPDLVESPGEFRPARWLGSKESRRGTPLEPLDHNLLSHPFSFGPRMCLGARIAQAELHALLARTVRTFRLRLDPPGQRWAVRNDFLTKPDPFPRIAFEPRAS